MRTFLSLFLLLIIQAGFAQKKIPVIVLFKDTSLTYTDSRVISYDTVKIVKELSSKLNNWRNKGYLGVSADTFYVINDTLCIQMFLGEKFNGIFLKNGNLSDVEIAEFSLNKVFSSDKPLSFSKIQSLKEKIIKQYENSGYPFASCSLDSFGKDGVNYFASLYVEKNAFITWDTIARETPVKLRQKYLQSFLGIKPGKYYNELVAARIDSRLNLLAYAEPIKKAEVSISNDKAKANIFLKDRKANQFDLLIGILPGSSGQKVLITGKAQLHLMSVFGVGEEFKLKWEKLQPKTQTLDVKVIYPFMFGTPLGLNVDFEFYKKDTSFLNFSGNYGLQYQLQANDYIKGAYRNLTTVILNTDTNFIKTNRRLPPNIDLSINQFSLQLYLQRLNYRFNPTNGFELKTTVSFGAKTIRKNNAIIGLQDSERGNSFSYLYDSIKLNSFVMQYHLLIDKFWPLAKRQTIRTQLEGEYQFNRMITDNELYRLGGTESLRGFDDRSVLSPYYVMANLEYRYLLSRNAFFFAFINAAMVKEYRNFKSRPFDFPYGFGAGAAIETRIGMFALSYALGARQDEKPSFRTSKIHFGYINYF